MCEMCVLPVGGNMTPYSHSSAGELWALCPVSLPCCRVVAETLLPVLSAMVVQQKLPGNNIPPCQDVVSLCPILEFLGLNEWGMWLIFVDTLSSHLDVWSTEEIDPKWVCAQMGAPNRLCQSDFGTTVNILCAHCG